MQTSEVFETLDICFILILAIPAVIILAPPRPTTPLRFGYDVPKSEIKSRNNYPISIFRLGEEVALATEGTSG